MRRLTLTLDIVTPLFLGGADPRGAPELRVSSFRGVLRYWLRAALGGVIGDCDIDALLKAEATVFGDTRGVSPIEIRLSKSELCHRGYNPLPHKAMRFPFNGFNPGQNFQITFMDRQTDTVSWYAAVNALLLAVRFGGLGRRSRRGFGSLSLKQANISQAQLSENWLRLLKQVPTSSEEWEQNLKDLLKATEVAVDNVVANRSKSTFRNQLL